MSDKKKIDISYLSPEEQGVLNLLEEKGKCLYGNIFRELSLSQIRGAEIVLSLVTKGYIQNVGKTSYYELTVELKNELD